MFGRSFEPDRAAPTKRRRNRHRRLGPLRSPDNVVRESTRLVDPVGVNAGNQLMEAVATRGLSTFSPPLGRSVLTYPLQRQMGVCQEIGGSDLV